jgi:hypothetical protein
MVRAPVADNMASRVGRARHRLLLYIPLVPNPGHQSASQMKLKAGKRHRPAAPEPRGRARGFCTGSDFRKKKKEKREAPLGEVSFLNPLTSFDHLVGAREQARWHGETDGLSGRHVDDKLYLGRKLHRQIARLLAFQNPIHKVGAAAVVLAQVDAIADQTAILDVLAESIDRGQSRRQRKGPGGGQYSNTIAHFALDFSRKESVRRGSAAMEFELIDTGFLISYSAITEHRRTLKALRDV